eukprot:g58823.t1
MRFVVLPGPGTIAELCTAKGIDFETGEGQGFYKVIKKENISNGKAVIVRKDGEWVTDSKQARALAGLGAGNSLGPGQIPAGVEVYVQSTSTNRKIPKNGSALVWLTGEAADDSAAGDAADSAHPAVPPAPATTDQTSQSQQPPASSQQTKRKAKAEPAAAPKQKAAKKAKTTGGLGNEGTPEGWTWPHDTLLFWESPDIKHSDKLAMFDFDGCLANTSLFKKGPDAWSYLFEQEVPARLREAHEKGYKVVILTNQSDIGRAAKPDSRKKAILEKTGRLGGFAKRVGIPLQILVATAKNKTDDAFRKPAVGMWTYLTQHANGGVTPDKSKCFFVGDAAGRPKDHGNTDKVFAERAGLTFATEAQFFKKLPGTPLP